MPHGDGTDRRLQAASHEGLGRSSPTRTRTFAVCYAPGCRVSSRDRPEPTYASGLEPDPNEHGLSPLSSTRHRKRRGRRASRG